MLWSSRADDGSFSRFPSQFLMYHPLLFCYCSSCLYFSVFAIQYVSIFIYIRELHSTLPVWAGCRGKRSSACWTTITINTVIKDISHNIWFPKVRIFNLANDSSASFSIETHLLAWRQILFMYGQKHVTRFRSFFKVHRQRMHLLSIKPGHWQSGTSICLNVCLKRVHTCTGSGGRIIKIDNVLNL